MAPKTILLAGATGKQGCAFIDALTAEQERNKETDATSSEALDPPFHILALTRDPSSPSAKNLTSRSNLTVVKGDLEDVDSIRRVFEEAKEKHGGVWGVFCVLQFPGLGKDGLGEEKQGKNLANLALEYKASLFVYSCSERGGESFDDQATRGSHRAKVAIERHLKSLGEKGLTWTILRPTFFMENYDGTIGSITTAVLQCGLKPTTKVQLVAVKDIGEVAVGVFKNPEPYEKKILVITKDFLTMREQKAAYQRATGCSPPAIPAFLARILLAINSHTRELISDLERVYEARTTGAVPELESQVELANKAYPIMQTFEEWAKGRTARQEENRESNWNQVSLWQLITGKL